MKCSLAGFVLGVDICALIKEILRSSVSNTEIQVETRPYLHEFCFSILSCLMKSGLFVNTDDIMDCPFIERVLHSDSELQHCVFDATFCLMVFAIGFITALHRKHHDRFLRR